MAQIVDQSRFYTKKQADSRFVRGPLSAETISNLFKDGDGTGTLPGNVLVPGTITQQEIADGAMRLRHFIGADVNPPVKTIGVSDPLPALPSTSFPEGAMVFWAKDQKLYVNRADKWESAVRAPDLSGILNEEQLTGAIRSTAPFARNIRPVQVVAALPSLPADDPQNPPHNKDYPPGATVFLTSTGKMYTVSDRDAATGSVTADHWELLVRSPDLKGILSQSDFDDIMVRTASFAQKLRDIQIVAALPNLLDAPTLAKYPTGSTVFLTQDDGVNKGQRLYVVREPSPGAYQWTPLVSLPELSGVLSAEQLDTEILTTAHFAKSIRPVELVDALPTDFAIYTAGSVVFLKSASQLYTSTGTAWTLSVPDNSISADKLMANSVVAGKIKAGVVTATELATDAVTAEKLAANAVVARNIKAGEVQTGHMTVNTIDGSVIKTGTLNADRIVANWLTAGAIKTGAIGANEIATDAVIAGKIAADAVLARNIKAGEIQTQHMTVNTIDGAVIKTGTLSADRIVANWLTAGAISAGAISTNELATDAVTALKLAANAVVARNIKAGEVATGHMAANSIEGDRIKVNTLDGDRIKVNSITAGLLQAGAVTTDKLIVGSFENLMEDGAFQRAAADGCWAEDGQGFKVWTDASYVHTGLGSAIKAHGATYAGWPATTDSSLYNRMIFDVKDGDKVYLEGWARQWGADGYAVLRVYFYRDRACTDYVNIVELPWFAAADCTGWKFQGGIRAVPDGARWARVIIQVTGQHAGLWAMDDLFVRKVTASAYIDQLDAGLIKTGILDCQDLTVRNLSADAINAGSLSVDRLTINRPFWKDVVFDNDVDLGSGVVGVRWHGTASASTPVQLVYNGVTYSIAAGTTASRYIYFNIPASGTTGSFSTSDTIPDATTGGRRNLIVANVRLYQTGTAGNVVNHAEAHIMDFGTMSGSTTEFARGDTVVTLSGDFDPETNSYVGLRVKKNDGTVQTRITHQYMTALLGSTMKCSMGIEGIRPYLWVGGALSVNPNVTENDIVWCKKLGLDAANKNPVLPSDPSKAFIVTGTINGGTTWIAIAGYIPIYDQVGNVIAKLLYV